MFGKSGKEEVVQEPTYHGWTETSLRRLREILHGDRPHFSIDLTGYRQCLGRRVYRPKVSDIENELWGRCAFFGTQAEGQFAVAPIGSVGTIYMAGQQHHSDDRLYTPLIWFSLDILNSLQEMRLQNMMQLSFATNCKVRLRLTLLPVVKPDDRLSQLRDDGGTDAMLLDSFHFISESGDCPFSPP